MRRLAPLLLVAAACNPQRTAGPAPATSTAAPMLGKSAEAFSAPTAPRAPGYHYTFRLDPSASHLDAEVCFVGSVPERLLAPMPEAAPFLETVRGPQGPLRHEGGRVELAGVAEGSCVEYRVDVAALMARKSRRDGVARVGRDVMLSPDWWLWAPSPRREVSIRARFDERRGLAASVPWPRPGGDFPYTIPETCFDWKAQAVFGELQTRRLEVRGGALDVVTLGEGFGPRAPAVDRWIDRSAAAAAGLFGEFPVPRGQVLLVPGGGDFGYALQGGGASATLLMGRRPSDAQLAEDWKAVHELLHFSLPPMLTTEAWFYEGVVTYWTAVARARAGLVSEAYGWWELLDGFERGEASGTGRTLREESRAMHETHAYWRVYWAGAALAWMIDVRLHREQNTSLEALIAGSFFGREIAPSGKADDVVAALDVACGCTIASEVAGAHLDARAFPDTSTVAKTLGVAIGRPEHAAMDEEAPLAAVRRAIMARR